MSGFDRDTVGSFFAVIHGAQTGILCIASMKRDPANPKKKSPMVERFFDYPREVEAALNRVETALRAGHDVYACAHLLDNEGEAPARKKERALPFNSLYADIDEAELPASTPEPTLILQTSPGRRQGYWSLTAPIDPVAGEALNKRLAAMTGSDPSGHDRTQLLRIPGTLNFKYDPAPPVELVSITGTVHDPAELDRILPPLPAGKTTAGDKATADDAGDGATVEPPVRLSKTARERWEGKRPKKHADGSLDRSGSLHAIACDLARAGASESTIVEAINERDATLGWNKYTSRADAAAQYEAIARKAVEEAQSRAGGSVGRGPSQATLIVSIVTASGAELFHDPEGTPFVTLRVGSHQETWPLRSRQYKDYLSAQYHAQYQATPGTQALNDALNTLGGMSRFAGKEHPVYVRIAEHEGAIYLFLADEEWRSVKVSSAGWEVVASASVPVKFRRPKGMLTLPAPVRGGNFEGLRDLLNLLDDDQFMLIMAWLVAALRPRGPFPILDLSGEQGSAKSTTARLLRRLIDPNKAPLRTEPREERDLAIAASNGLVVAYDNLSYIPPWFSDALCRLSTGGGFGTRTLYENDEETLFDYMRPSVFTAIVEAAVRGDLLDRTLTVNLPPVATRRTETDLEAAFLNIWPATLGALLDAVSTALRNLQTTKLDKLPRMADFALWVEAAAPAFGWERGAFLAAYERNREAANDIAMEASPLAAVLRVFIEGQPLGTWEGTASTLLNLLNMRAEAGVTSQRGWPKAPHILSGQLKRLAPNLRKVGVNVETNVRVSGGERHVVITRTQEVRDEASQASQRHNPHGQAKNRVTHDAEEASLGAEEASQTGASNPFGVNGHAGATAGVRP